MDLNNEIQLAFNYYQAGDIQRAEKICKELLRYQPENADILHFLGIIYYQLGNADLSIIYIKKALLINPNFADAYYNLGVVLHKKNKLMKQ
jgi:Tfp pilus assembly protein PilF